LQPRRLLVVDDNVDAAKSLALLLRLNGHEVWTAYDGVAALETAQTRSPDGVLLDIGLPRMDGLEVARRLRQELCMKDALLIALTGYSQEEDRRRSLDAGFNAHLIKPVDLDALDAVLSHAEAIASAV
jgi:CheY-like chemotaxis protein